MQVHLSKQNSAINLKNHNYSSVSLFWGVLLISATLSAMFLIPGYWSMATGLFVLIAAIKFLVLQTNRKPLLLEITEQEIIYLSDNNNEFVKISIEEIDHIEHRFCELIICTKDKQIHTVNLLNTGSEQTRWEIKEYTKKFHKA
jgi:hypothetical protein